MRELQGLELEEVSGGKGGTIAFGVFAICFFSLLAISAMRRPAQHKDHHEHEPTVIIVNPPATTSGSTAAGISN